MFDLSPEDVESYVVRFATTRGKIVRINGKSFLKLTDGIECDTLENAKKFAEDCAKRDPDIIAGEIFVMAKDGDRYPFYRTFRYLNDDYKYCEVKDSSWE